MFDFIIEMIADIFDGMTNANIMLFSDIGGIQPVFGRQLRNIVSYTCIRYS